MRQLDLFALKDEGVRDKLRIHCFFGCAFVVEEYDAHLAHSHMEAHYEMTHRTDLERLRREGYIG